MSIKEKINDEYKTALKSKDKNKISTYRLILSGIKDLDISNRSGPNKKETDDEDIKKLLKKMIKQRNESVEIYKKNKREDLLKIEQGEIDLLSIYLPKQLSEEETKKICSEIISKVFSSFKEAFISSNATEKDCSAYCASILFLSLCNLGVSCSAIYHTPLRWHATCNIRTK